MKLVRNFGEPAASFAGMSFASGEAVAVIAADLQDPPEDVNRLIAEWEQGHKVVLAVRKDRHGDPFFHAVFAFILNILFKLVYKDFSPQGVGFFSNRSAGCKSDPGLRGKEYPPDWADFLDRFPL